MIFLYSFCFLAAFFIAIVFIVYLFKIPFMFAGSDLLIVEEYYVKNAVWNIPSDLVFILIYLSIAMLISKACRVKETTLQTIIVIVTTAFLTGLFCVFFNFYGPEGWFFTRWFRTMGWKSIVYDVILITSIYLIMMSLYTQFFQPQGVIQST